METVVSQNGRAAKVLEHQGSPNPSQEAEVMAQATHAYTTFKFHNLSNEALADAIGQADALLKGAEAECKALKEEFKTRGILTVAGERFTVTRSDQAVSTLSP